MDRYLMALTYIFILMKGLLANRMTSWLSCVYTVIGKTDKSKSSYIFPRVEDV